MFRVSMKRKILGWTMLSGGVILMVALRVTG